MTSNNLRTKNLNFFKDLLSFTVGKWYWLVLLLIASMGLSLIYSVFVVTPLYVSTGKIYIQNQEREDQSLNTAELAISSSLMKDFQNWIVDRAILNIVEEEMENRYSYNTLTRAITLENPEGTRFIEISVKTPSAADSKQIVDSLLEVSQDKIKDWLGTNCIKVIRTGSLASKPSVPNVTANVVRGGAIGVLAFFFLAFILYFFDDSIQNADDVEKYLGLTVLANIPFNQNKLRSK